MLPLRIALSISALSLTQINTWRITTVIKVQSTELDATPSGKIRSAQFSFPALMIGLLESGTPERARRSSVAIRFQESNHSRVKSMMLSGLQILHLPLHQSLTMVELRFGIFSLTHLVQLLHTSISSRTAPMIQLQRQSFVLVAHLQSSSLVMTRELSMSTDQEVWSMSRYLTKINKTGCFKLSRKTISQPMTKTKTLTKLSEQYNKSFLSQAEFPSAFAPVSVLNRHPIIIRF